MDFHEVWATNILMWKFIFRAIIQNFQIALHKVILKLISSQIKYSYLIWPIAIYEQNLANALQILTYIIFFNVDFLFQLVEMNWCPITFEIVGIWVVVYAVFPPGRYFTHPVLLTLLFILIMTPDGCFLKP